MRTMAALTVLVSLVGAASGVSGQTLTPTAPPPLTPTAPPTGPSAAAPQPSAPPAAPFAPAAPPPQPSAPPAAPAAQPSPPASSNTVTTLGTFKVGNWNAAAVSAPGSQALDNCAAETPYKSGITLGFWVDHNYQWGMYLINPNWRLAQGSTYPITYAIDNGRTAAANASAASVNEADISLPGDMTLFRQFMAGNMLNIVAAETTFQFVLTDTSQMLPDLLQCVNSYVGAGPQNNNPNPNANPFQSLITH